jgi:hypothetical protein
MLYGDLNLQATGGLRESMMFSRPEACEAFVRAVHDLRRILASGRSPGRLANSAHATLR